MPAPSPPYPPCTAGSPARSSRRDRRRIETIVGAGLGYTSAAATFVEQLQNRAARGDPGLSAHVAGPAAIIADEFKTVKSIDSTLLLATVAVVIVLLLAHLPQPSAMAAAHDLRRGGADRWQRRIIYLLDPARPDRERGQRRDSWSSWCWGQAPTTRLLLTARYREELRRHQDRHQAMAAALRQAGPAIIASAGTVIAGMLCLLAADSGNISGLGPVAALGIAARPARHAHPATRPAGHLRPVGVLASSGPTTAPPSPPPAADGPRQPGSSRAARAPSGPSPPSCSAAPPWGSSASRSARSTAPNPSAAPRHR